MPEADAPVSLEARNPFEMRVKLGEDMPETNVRSALKTGDIGFLHSFTTGSAVDGPGIRLVAWTTACMFRCQFCHNPDTWTLTNGIPVALDRAIEEIQRYANSLKMMHGGFTLSGGEPLMQDRFAARLLAATKTHGRPHRARNRTASTASGCPTRNWAAIDLVILDMKGFTLEQHKRVTGGLSNEPVHRLRPPPRRPPAADVAALRAGPGTDRRRRGNAPAGRVRRVARAWSNAPRCCRSTSSAATSGSGSASTTSSKGWSRRREQAVDKAEAIFAEAGL